MGIRLHGEAGQEGVSKATVLQQLYGEIRADEAFKKAPADAPFPIDVPAQADLAPEELQEVYGEIRAKLLALFEGSLKGLVDSQNRPCLQNVWPTPGETSVYFDQEDLEGALASAERLLDPKDPDFAKALTHSLLGAVSLLGDTFDEITRRGDTRGIFKLLQKLSAPVVSTAGERKPLAEIPFAEREKELAERKNAFDMLNLRASNVAVINAIKNKFAKAPDVLKRIGGLNTTYRATLQRMGWTNALVNEGNLNFVLSAIFSTKREAAEVQQKVQDLIVELTMLQLGQNDEFTKALNEFIAALKPAPAAEVKAPR